MLLCGLARVRLAARVSSAWPLAVRSFSQGPSPSAPAGALFTKSHEFVAIGEDSLAVCGVSAHAVELLGEVVYVELPSVGDKVSRGKAFGVVESVKAASDVYAPVSGEVVAVNEDLEATPDLVSEDPFGKGWMIKIKPSEDLGTDMMSEEQYSAFCEQE